jgi:hypothetical protein
MLDREQRPRATHGPHQQALILAPGSWNGIRFVEAVPHELKDGRPPDADGTAWPPQLLAPALRSGSWSLRSPRSRRPRAHPVSRSGTPAGSRRRPCMGVTTATGARSGSRSTTGRASPRSGRPVCGPTPDRQSGGSGPRAARTTAFTAAEYRRPGRIQTRSRPVGEASPPR